MLKTKLINQCLYQQCRKCGEWKIANTDFFPPCKTGKNGIRGECWVCRKSYQSEYYKKYHIENKEESNERCRAYYGANSEKLKAYQREHPQHRATPPYDDKQKERQRIYYELNTEKVIARKRKYRLCHKDEYKMYFNKSKAKRKTMAINVLVTFTNTQWDSCKREFDFRCSYCGKEVKELAQDHFYPLSLGGNYTVENIVPACTSCNSSKSNKLFIVWYPKQKFYCKSREKKILDYLLRAK